MTSAVSLVSSATSDSLVLELDATGKRLGADASHLASGLRVESATDDPSGYAVATQTKVAALGYDRGTQNLQDATNFANVGNQALSSVISILQRMHTLAAEANTDVASPLDRKNLQVEFASLTAEIDAIGQRTTFNGRQVFPPSAAAITGGVAGAVIQDPGFETPSLPGYLFTSYTSTAGNPSAYPYTGPWTLNGTAAVAAVGSRFDANLGTPPPTQGTQALLLAAGDSASQTIPNFSNLFSYTFSFDVIQRTFTHTPTDTVQMTLDGVPITTTTISNLANYVTVTSAPIITTSGPHVLGIADIAGHSIDVDNFTIAGQYIGALTTSELSVQDGTAEGSVSALTMPSLSSDALGINALDLTQGSPGGTQSGPGYAEFIVGSAITAVTSAQAEIGAQINGFAQRTQNNNVASVNLTASASDITALDIASAVATYTRDQVEQKAGTALLAQSQVNAASVLQLFTSAGT